jgi:hypothetical protein
VKLIIHVYFFILFRNILEKRPNSPTAAETPPEKKQKVKKGKEKKKVKSRNKSCGK